MLKSMGIVLIGAALASPVIAAGNDEGFLGSNTLRLGVGIAQNYVETTYNALPFDEHGTALEVFAGYEFNRWFALEGGYLNGGDATEDFFDGAIRLESSGVYATALGSLPITDALSVYGRAGVIKWDAEVRETVDQQVSFKLKRDGKDPIFGVGLAATVEGALVRLEYRYADFDFAESRIIGLSIVWQLPLGR